MLPMHENEFGAEKKLKCMLHILDTDWLWLKGVALWICSRSVAEKKLNI